jgi:hypothetical protein
MCFSCFLCDFGRASNNKLKASRDALTTCKSRGNVAIWQLVHVEKQSTLHGS